MVNLLFFTRREQSNTCAILLETLNLSLQLCTRCIPDPGNWSHLKEFYVKYQSILLYKFPGARELKVSVHLYIFHIFVNFGSEYMGTRPISSWFLSSTGLD